LYLLLFEFRLVALLALPIFELAIIHQPANRGLRRRSNLHQIDLFFFGQGIGERETYDPECLSFQTNQPDLGRVDLAIDP
jgi:hypothetical protein